MLSFLAHLFGLLIICSAVLAMMPVGRDWTFDVWKFRIGLVHDLVRHSDGSKYLERWIIYFGGTLRFHYFHSGDDDRAPHSHPWFFVTFPLVGYSEQVYETIAECTDGVYMASYYNWVQPFRFHFRPKSYVHIVRAPRDGRKVKTIVLSGLRQSSWGFFPVTKGIGGWREFIPWRQWK